ncbi:MAG: alanine racemase [Acidaminococcus sp.]|uniref:Alanine racemase n=1 Tax=Acidaminococcus intestini TaxID=187327 RepID=A0A943EJ21_9FIRM|nr:alanine racemase [Acidaminococcus sp.]MBS5518867.1 alanine racemase [Acidaminococcus intestini]MDY2739080.1 alanine racemase [Acidaminococcus sp.]
MRARNVWAEVDLSAIAHNVQVTRKALKPGTKICAVVKADAYGHGAVPVATAALAAGVNYLAVSMTQEALELREAGIMAPILILGTMTEEHEKALVDYNITQTVYDLAVAQELSAAALQENKVAKVHLAVDTGMNRIGCRPEEAANLAEAISKLPHVELEGMFSHFASADEMDKSFAESQYRKFMEADRAIKDRGIQIPLVHIDNSAGITEMKHTECDMVRQGITLYGLWPSDDVERCLDLKPALSLKAEVVFVKDVPAGEKIGYGCTYETKAPMKVATIPLGYADGYSRALSNRGYITIRGYKAPVVGRICMDQFMVDVTNVPGVHKGDEAVIFGPGGVSLDQMAKWVGTIPYELMCLLSTRVPRKYTYTYTIKHYENNRF